GAHFDLELGRAAHEFLNECRARALRPPDNQLEEGLRKFKPARVKVDQFGATLLIRQWKLYRLVNAAGPGRESRFNLIRAVSRENEYDVGVFPQPIHLIQQFVEEDFFARATHPFSRAGDEVNIFNNDHRGLQEASEAEIFIEQTAL